MRRNPGGDSVLLPAAQRDSAGEGDEDERADATTPARSQKTTTHDSDDPQGKALGSFAALVRASVLPTVESARLGRVVIANDAV